MVYSHECTVTFRITALAPSEQQDPRRLCAVYHMPSFGMKEIEVEQLLWNSVPYDKRGWCAAETQWSQTRNSSESTWTLTETGRNELESKRAPMPPELFRQRAEEGKLRFTHRSDLSPVLDRQEAVFKKKAAHCESLSLSRLEPDLRLQNETRCWHALESSAKKEGCAGIVCQARKRSTSSSQPCALIPSCNCWRSARAHAWFRSWMPSFRHGIPHLLSTSRGFLTTLVNDQRLMYQHSGRPRPSQDRKKFRIARIGRRT